jgi:hypothetical protein
VENVEEITRNDNLSSLMAAFLEVKSLPSDKHWWLTPVILATQEAEIGRLWLKTSLAK